MTGLVTVVTTGEGLVAQLSAGRTPARVTSVWLNKHKQLTNQFPKYLPAPFAPYGDKLVASYLKKYQYLNYMVNSIATDTSDLYLKEDVAFEIHPQFPHINYKLHYILTGMWIGIEGVVCCVYDHTVRSTQWSHNYRQHLQSVYMDNMDLQKDGWG